MKKMDYQSLLLLTVFFLPSMVACSTNPIRTHSDMANNAIIGHYQTFAWVAEERVTRESGTYISPLNINRISSAIEKTLVDKGYVMLTVGGVPDFSVSFTVGTRDKVKVSSYPEHFQRFDWNWPYAYHKETSVHQYTQGMLAIDVFDYANGQPVWHGVAEKRVIESDLNNPEPVIEMAVKSILAEFPDRTD